MRVLSRHFLATPSWGPLHPGHLLVVPIEHVTSIAMLGTEVDTETMTVVATVRAALQAYWRKGVVLFEHGVGTSGGGCGIAHAHLHVVPVPSAPDLSSLTGFAWAESTAADWLHTAQTLSGGYLYVSTSATEHALTPAADPPSQLLRRWLATHMELNQWDWRSMAVDSRILHALAPLESRQPGVLTS